VWLIRTGQDFGIVRARHVIAISCDDVTRSRCTMASSSDDGLPFAQYTSATAVHTTLLVFTVLFLPRAALLWEPTKHSSTDKPQHEFLDALTASPISTVAWMCIGVAFIQVSWGGWVRSWYIANVLRSEGGAGERDGDERLRRVKLQKQRFKVIASYFAAVRRVDCMPSI
jgi:hypothetical protein